MSRSLVTALFLYNCVMQEKKSTYLTTLESFYRRRKCINDFLSKVYVFDPNLYDLKKNERKIKKKDFDSFYRNVSKKRI